MTAMLSDTAELQRKQELLSKFRTLVSGGKDADAQEMMRSLSLENENDAKIYAVLFKEKQGLHARMGARAAGVNEIQKLVCPVCSAPLHITSAITKSIICPSCQTALDPTKDPLAKLPHYSSRILAPRDFLTLGLQGTIDGKEFQIIGRGAISCRMQEYDDEDHVFTSGTWQYDEWMLVGEDRTFRFLTEDSEGYILYRKSIPKNPAMPKPGDRNVENPITSGMLEIREYGAAAYTGFEGELTWTPEAGESIDYVDAQFPDGRNVYSIEWRTDSHSGEICEIEFFLGKKLRRREVAEMFGQADIVASDTKLEADKKVTWAFALSAILVGFILLFKSCAVSGSGVRTVFTRDFNQSVVGENGFVTETFSLPKTGSIYALQLDVTIADNSDAWLAAELVDQDQNALSAMEGDFWRESGYDDEGSWSESDTSTSKYFRLEQPGIYALRIFTENAAVSTSAMFSNSAKTFSGKVSVFEDVQLARYFLLGAMLAWSYAVVLIRFKKWNPLWTFVGIVALPFMIILLLSKLKGAGGDGD